jgi:ADP-heptose:LPS heptosyltransferase
VGVAVLWLVGALRRSRERPQAPRRIGLVKTTGIGDMVLLTAVIDDVLAAFPQADVVVVGSAENVGLIDAGARVSVLELPAATPWKALPLLRRQRFDVLVDFGQWSRLEGLYTALCGARWTAGFDTPGQRRHHGYDAPVAHRDDVPELENYRRLTATLGIASTAMPRFAPQGPTPLADLGPYVVFHLFPGGFRSELREWAPERWVALAAKVAELGCAVVLTGAPADAPRAQALAEQLRAAGARVEDVAGRFKLRQTVDVLAGAACVVSVNTGVMHIAAALGVPTVALNGPTSSLRWGPVGERVTNVDSDLPGCGFLNLGFEYEGQREDCMAGVPVDRVAAAVAAALEEQAHV